EAENAYAEARTAHLEPLRERIFQEVKGRVLETDLSVPTRRGDWWYYGRTEEDAQYGIQCRTAAVGDDWTPPVLEPGVPVPGEEILLDGNVEAEGHEFCSLGAFDMSDDGTRMLWSVDVKGSELYTVHVRDLATGEKLSDAIENTSKACFTPGGQSVIHTPGDEAWRPDTLWLHRIGTPATEDVKLLHEPDERFWLGAGITRSKKYLVIGLGSKITSEELLVDLSDPTAAPQVVWPRRDGVEYSVDHAIVDGEDRLLILHNDGALDFELVSVAASDPLGERRVLLPHVPGRRLLDVDCFRDFATVEFRADGMPHAALLDHRTGELDVVAFDEPLYEAYFSGNPEWHAPFLRMGYTSFVTPSTVLELEPATGEKHVRKQQPVLGGYGPADYGQRRVWAPAPDGVQVPVSLIWKRSFGEPGDGIRPVHLSGYGSYEHSIDPGFSTMRLPMLDRGVVFAVAHVRGGGEMG